MHISIINTPIGNMLAKADNNVLISLDFTNDTGVLEYNSSVLSMVQNQLKEYFYGRRKEFTVPLAPAGTPFQMSVWQTLQKIPYGKTISYSEEAAMLGRLSALRAVANANGRNPIAIIIPCHRVIASDGGIGGYSGEVWRKQYLLSLESKYVDNIDH